jgi:hypothetical protein
MTCDVLIKPWTASASADSKQAWHTFVESQQGF